MGTYVYDNALLDKLNNWIKDNDNLHILGVNQTNQLFEIKADENKDNPITLPLITLSRGRGFDILSTNKQMLSYEGPRYKRTIYNKGTDKAYSTSSSIAAIPISLSYQIDVYTRKAEQADILVRNLIFNIINYPTFNITIPLAEQESTARITLNGVVEDNSDIPERFIVGNFTRLSLLITVENAYLWDAKELRDNAIDIIIDDSMEPWEWNGEHTKVIKPDLSKMDKIIIPNPSSLN